MIINLEQRQYHCNNLRILYGGSPVTWVASKMERDFVWRIGQYYTKQYPDKQIHVVAPNWENATEITNLVKQYPNDLLVVCSLIDAIWFTAISDIMPIEEAGYTLTGLRIDFWAAVCFEKFQTYSTDQLAPTNFKYLFLNYNRKPRQHRIDLVQELERQNLTDVGLITLGNSNYTLNESPEDYIKFGSKDVYGKVNIPNDVYSLGRLDIWQQSFINIVSETVSPLSPVFLSEKIYKPIIGMRPFIINGSIEIYQWLQNAGFDCFTDLFPVTELMTSPDNAAKIIADSISQYKDKDLDSLYKQILPRLEHNRTRFFEYAQEELNKL